MEGLSRVWRALRPAQYRSAVFPLNTRITGIAKSPAHWPGSWCALSGSERLAGDGGFAAHIHDHSLCLFDA
ncbi:MAG: hypothetical protein ABIP13_07970, partial [Tepidiformaceae bacterium]